LLIHSFACYSYKKSAFKMPKETAPSLPLVYVNLIAAGPARATHNEDARVPEGQCGSQHYAVLSLKLDVFDTDDQKKSSLVMDIHTPDSSLQQRSAPAFQHHQGNQALLTRCRQSQLSLAAVEGKAIRHLKSLGLRQKQMIICAFDSFHQQAYITHQMPTLARFMGVRNIDLQALSALAPVVSETPANNEPCCPTLALDNAFAALRQLYRPGCMA
jgi:hypothetical protein